MELNVDLKKAINNQNIEETESIIKKELEINPKSIQLWLKLSLTELQFPFEDYESALQCISQIYNIDPCNIDAIILETGIRWHSFGFINEELFKRLVKTSCVDEKKTAIIYYLQSLYYEDDKDIKNRKLLLKKSIEVYDRFVYPYRDLGRILLSELKFKEGNEMLKKAVANVKKVLQIEDPYDFTDVDVYIAEFITGTEISYINFESLKEQIKV